MAGVALSSPASAQSPAPPPLKAATAAKDTGATAETKPAMLHEDQRLVLRVDYGRGNEDGMFYFSVSEAF